MTRLLKSEMKWKRVIVLAVVSAAVTAVLNCIPFLENTSFSAPAETYEAWIVLALYIILNCRGYKDAMIKTFVFFLISQPLCYLFEVPFKTAGWGLFTYYRFWGILTLLTIPGSAVAYRVKKGDMLSAVILSAANGLMIITGMNRISTVIYEFPHQLLSVIFCLAVPFALIFLVLHKKNSRILGCLLASAVIAAGLYLFVLFPQDGSTSYLLEEGNWSVVSVSEPGLEVTVDSEDSMTLSSHRNGEYELVLADENGKKVHYSVSVTGGYHSISVLPVQSAESDE